MSENSCLLVGLDLPTLTQWSAQSSLDELGELASTAGLQVEHKILQRRQAPHYRHYVGEGKLEEIKTLIQQDEIEVLIADDELSPGQQKTLEETLKIKVLDRSGLILDIFSQRAHTAEAQLQVELAQLEYMMPRLTRLWTHLSRLGSGVGARGPGETQLETDKRQIRKRMQLLKERLEKVQSQRELRRKDRCEIPVLSGAIVGYTNAGKSTLMNHLSKAELLSEDKLFATLDPTSRKSTIPHYKHLVLTDTVGFIQKLPHHLINAFYATLEEVSKANFLIHVIDASHPNLEGTLHTSNEIIKNLKSDGLPRLYLFNKMDQVSKPNQLKEQLKAYQPSLFVSAFQDDLHAQLSQAFDGLLGSLEKEFVFRIPYTRMEVLNYIHENGRIISKTFSDYIDVSCVMNPSLGERVHRSLAI